MKDPGVDRRGFLRQLGMGVALAPAWNARSALAVPGANERLLVGVIGCGSMGNSHMKALLGMQDSANIKVAAVCDVFRKRLDAAAALTGGTPYSDYRTLLAQKELDYVLIATPEHWHHRMTLDALDAG
ncbi:MAG: Gfo/Idh/MocA family oxidoreductase, partial [Acidobacteriota bacterium]|nr:Gfo/Idh/MocA family oxidoreductase [Acidobacteriota bacterium]